MKKESGDKTNAFENTSIVKVGVIDPHFTAFTYSALHKRPNDCTTELAASLSGAAKQDVVDLCEKRLENLPDFLPVSAAS